MKFALILRVKDPMGNVKIGHHSFVSFQDCLEEIEAVLESFADEDVEVLYIGTEGKAT